MTTRRNKTLSINDDKNHLKNSRRTSLINIFPDSSENIIPENSISRHHFLEKHEAEKGGGNPYASKPITSNYETIHNISNENEKNYHIETLKSHSHFGKTNHNSKKTPNFRPISDTGGMQPGMHTIHATQCDDIEFEQSLYATEKSQLCKSFVICRKIIKMSHTQKIQISSEDRRFLSNQPRSHRRYTHSNNICLRPQSKSVLRRFESERVKVGFKSGPNKHFPYHPGRKESMIDINLYNSKSKLFGGKRRSNFARSIDNDTEETDLNGNAINTLHSNFNDSLKQKTSNDPNNRIYRPKVKIRNFRAYQSHDSDFEEAMALEKSHNENKNNLTQVTQILAEKEVNENENKSSSSVTNSKSDEKTTKSALDLQKSTHSYQTHQMDKQKQLIEIRNSIAHLHDFDQIDQTLGQNNNKDTVKSDQNSLNTNQSITQVESQSQYTVDTAQDYYTNNFESTLQEEMTHENDSQSNTDALSRVSTNIIAKQLQNLQLEHAKSFSEREKTTQNTQGSSDETSTGSSSSGESSRSRSGSPINQEQSRSVNSISTYNTRKTHEAIQKKISVNQVLSNRSSINNTLRQNNSATPSRNNSIKRKLVTRVKSLIKPSSKNRSRESFNARQSQKSQQERFMEDLQLTNIGMEVIQVSSIVMNHPDINKVKFETSWGSEVTLHSIYLAGILDTEKVLKVLQSVDSNNMGICREASKNSYSEIEAKFNELDRHLAPEDRGPPLGGSPENFIQQEIDLIHSQIRPWIYHNNPIAGFLYCNQKFSIFKAVVNKYIPKSVAVHLLNAQAATGVILDPISGSNYNLEEAVAFNIINRHFEILISGAFKSVFGYRDLTSKLDDKNSSNSLRKRSKSYENSSNNLSLKRNSYKNSDSYSQKLSCFQALKKGLISEEHAFRLLDVQLSTGGLIDPINNLRVPIHLVLERNLIDMVSLERLLGYPINHNNHVSNEETNTEQFRGFQDIFTDPGKCGSCNYRDLLKISFVDKETGMRLISLDAMLSAKNNVEGDKLKGSPNANWLENDVMPI